MISNRRPRISLSTLIACVLLPGSVIIAACGGSASISSKAPSAPTPPAASSMPTSQHVVMVVEENQSYASVVGNAAWPHLNALIKAGASATNYFADAHPSIPNYFMLTTGQPVTFDDSSLQVQNVDNIARHMLAAKVSFKVYAEGIKQGYVGGNTGLYVIRHNPFALLSDVASNTQIANQVIQPFTQFTSDVNSKALPAFSFVVPDLNDDAHNGTPQAADNWLQSNVIGPLAANPAFQSGGDGLLVVVFDESVGTDIANGGGHIACVLWGPIVKAGYTQSSKNIYQHQNLLRTVMEVLSLSNPPAAAGTASDMSEFFNLK
jgi:hypothetical protein